MTRRDHGFTLVELLVALTITVILTVLLASVVAATLGVWSQGRNRLDTYSNARQIMQRLGDELKGARANPSVSGGQIQFVENVFSFPMPSPIPVPSPTPGKAENIFFVAHGSHRLIAGRAIAARRLPLEFSRSDAFGRRGLRGRSS